MKRIQGKIKERVYNNIRLDISQIIWNNILVNNENKIWIRLRENIRVSTREELNEKINFAICNQNSK